MAGVIIRTSPSESSLMQSRRSARSQLGGVLPFMSLLNWVRARPGCALVSLPFRGTPMNSPTG